MISDRNRPHCLKDRMMRKWNSNQPEMEWKRGEKERRGWESPIFSLHKHFPKRISASVVAKEVAVSASILWFGTATPWKPCNRQEEKEP